MKTSEASVPSNIRRHNPSGTQLIWFLIRQLLATPNLPHCSRSGVSSVYLLILSPVPSCCYGPGTHSQATHPPQRLIFNNTTRICVKKLFTQPKTYVIIVLFCI